MDAVIEALGKIIAVGARGGIQSGRLALHVHVTYVLLCGPLLGRTEVHASPLLVEPEDVDHVPLAHGQLGAVAVKVKLVHVVEAIPLRGHDKGLAIVQKGQVVVDVYVGVAQLLEDLAGAEPVVGESAFGQKQPQVALMAVHGEDAQHIGVVRPLDAWNVMCGFGDGHFMVLSVLHVVDVHRHVAVLLPCFGVLEGVGVGIKGPVHWHVELAHSRLVEAEVGQTFSIARPKKGFVVAKLLFVHPVGGAIDDSVHFPIGGHLHFFT